MGQKDKNNCVFKESTIQREISCRHAPLADGWPEDRLEQTRFPTASTARWKRNTYNYTVATRRREVNGYDSQQPPLRGGSEIRTIIQWLLDVGR